MAQIAYGYEIELTPLQILTFYNAIANNGIMVKPRFALEIRDRSKTIKSFEVEVLNPAICQEKTVKQAQDMLESVTEPRGTAVSIHSPYYKIAGKTGTAQIAINNRSYSLDGVRYHRGSFCGYFPADKPKYSCIVVVDSSANSSVVSGARVAGVFKKIADKIFANDIALQREYMPQELASEKSIPFARDGFRTDLQSIIETLGLDYALTSSASEWVMSSVEDQKLVLNTRTIKEFVVPNVKGMGLRDAVYLLEKQGLQVEVKGYGIVKQQSLVPGQTIKNGDRIIIELG
ncbi:MAG: PASTA domain-containing protein [Bacteroidales bacterium]|nr:PASTA domain-containing protein [Bacteroidales bacterium]